MGTLENREDPAEMSHIAAILSGNTLFAKSNTIFREITTILGASTRETRSLISAFFIRF